jgi:predicted nuclease of restriction endonuclease-like RecB superfamily
LVPDSLLDYRIRDGVLHPRFLAEADHPWLRALIEEHLRFVGKPVRELDEYLRRGLPWDGAPPQSAGMSARILRQLMYPQGRPPTKPSVVRATLFGEAARSGASRLSAIGRCADALGLTREDVEGLLFADLPSERRLRVPDAWPEPRELGLRVNLALAQGFVSRSQMLRIDLLGNARTVVRHARLRGLICTVHDSASAKNQQDSSACTLEVSGPLSILRHTTLYGRALGEILPLLAWCNRFRLRAQCSLHGRLLPMFIQSGDPIFPAHEPRQYDSQLEERFAREFRRLSTDWDVIREPEPIAAEGTLIFPDFALQHRGDRTRRWLLEIIGFWTPNYIEQKVARLRAANLNRLILCVDASRNCSDLELPMHATTISFRRSVNVADVLRVIESRREHQSSDSGVTVSYTSS